MKKNTGRPLNLIPYFGGKTMFINWLSDYFIKGPKWHLIDVFGGSGVVSLNMLESYALVTLNDKNNRVVNLFEVLRNKYAEFILAVKYTPFSREEFSRCAVPHTDSVEDARRFFTRALLSFGAIGTQNDHQGVGFNREVKSKEKHFRVHTWNTKLDYLPEIAERLRLMQIENRCFRDLIPKYAKDNPSAVFYLDEPYYKPTRSNKDRYELEFEVKDFIDMANLVNPLPNPVAVSGYDHPFYDELFPPDKWNKILGPITKANTKKVDRQECLWINYEVPKAATVKYSETLTLF